MAKQKQRELTATTSAPAAPEVPTAQILRSVGLRLGAPIVIGWVIALVVHHWVGFAIMGALTVLVLGVGYWVWRRLDKSKRVAGILATAQGGNKQNRKAALDQLDASFKQGDLTATLAKAQLLMQDDPNAALTVLETVDLSKGLPAEADQVRFMRALIHLHPVRSEPDRARQLVDGIDLSRTEQPAVRAAMAAVVAEAWARTGQAKKAASMLEALNPDDPALGDASMQLWRAWAFAAAALNDTKRMRRALKRLAGVNPQLLGGFLVKRVHPLLEREARQMLTQSGAAPRRVQFQRR